MAFKILKVPDEKQLQTLNPVVYIPPNRHE